MATFVKPSGVSGLKATHPLRANITQFLEIGRLDKELVSDVALTISGANIVDDADIGRARAFVAGASIAQNLSVPQDCTILIVTAGRGTRAGTNASDCVFLCLNSSGNKIIFRYEYSSNGRYTIRYDGATGDVRNLSSDAFANDGAFNTGHAIAFHFADSEVMKSCLNGTIGAATDSTATAGSLGSPPVSVPFFAAFNSITIGANANFPIGAVVVFDKLLSDAELQSVTTDPWAMLDSGPAVGTLTGVQGADIIANGEQNITGSVTSIPSGNVPIGVRIGSTAGVGGTYLTGFTYATTASAGAFTFGADVPTGITTGTNMEVAVDYAPL